MGGASIDTAPPAWWSVCFEGSPDNGGDSEENEGAGRKNSEHAGGEHQQAVEEWEGLHEYFQEPSGGANEPLSGLCRLSGLSSKYVAHMVDEPMDERGLREFFSEPAWAVRNLDKLIEALHAADVWELEDLLMMKAEYRSKIMDKLEAAAVSPGDLSKVANALEANPPRGGMRADEAEKMLQKAEKRFAAAEAMQKNAQVKWESAMEMMREAKQILDDAEKVAPKQEEEEEWTAPAPQLIMKKEVTAEDACKRMTAALTHGFKLIKLMYGHLASSVLRHLFRCFQVRCILLGYNKAIKWARTVPSTVPCEEWAYHEGGGPLESRVTEYYY